MACAKIYILVSTRRNTALAGSAMVLVALIAALPTVQAVGSQGTQVPATNNRSDVAVSLAVRSRALDETVHIPPAMSPITSPPPPSPSPSPPPRPSPPPPSSPPQNVVADVRQLLPPLLFLMGVAAALFAAAVAFVRSREEVHALKFTRLFEEWTERESRFGGCIATLRLWTRQASTRISRLVPVGESLNGSPPTSSRTLHSYRSFVGPESCASSVSPERSPNIRSTIKNLDLDLAEEQSIKSAPSTQRSASSRSPIRSFNSMAPRSPIRSFRRRGSMDCSLAIACRSCVCMFALTMFILVNLLPLPDWAWESFWRAVDPFIASVRSVLPVFELQWPRT